MTNQEQIAFYDFDEIYAESDCIELANSYGFKLCRHNRCAATWRGGTNPESVAFTRYGFFDHVTKTGGNALQFCAMIKHGGIIQYAQNELGKRYGLTPKGYPRRVPGHSKYDLLLDDGYNELARYKYTDEAGGLIHQVVRLEHAKKAKQFLQCDAKGAWNTAHVEKVLYNLPSVYAAQEVVIVEGEKDADTLIAFGIVATTNAGGAKNWQESYSNSLVGKDVILLPDNDPAGRAHLDVVGKSIAGKARSIRVLTVSKLDKGDVTDWLTKEGGTPQKLLEAIAGAEKWIEPLDDDLRLAAAKEANQQPFRNYTLQKVTDEKGKPKDVKVPRHLNDLVNDAHLRLLAFPRKVGQTLFDHHKDSREIEYLLDVQELFAWMWAKTKTDIDWQASSGSVTKGEFMAALRSAATPYESISSVPHWPRRNDVFYSHPALPDADQDRKYLNGFVSFFAPATHEDRILIRTFICSMIYYQADIPRPVWIIDSEDGAGKGKTTLAEMVAKLYQCAPIACNSNDLRKGYSELVKRILSYTGRMSRVLMLDNVGGRFASDEFSSLVTCSSISGRVAYGRGEETRPNDLTYVITANSPNISNDVAIRSFFINLKTPVKSSSWHGQVLDYVERYRLNIFADIIAILDAGPAFQADIQTRFPEFERLILHPQCKDIDELGEVMGRINAARDEGNSDSDTAVLIEEIIRDRLAKIDVDQPVKRKVFIRSEVLNGWIKSSIPELRGDGVQMVRNLAKNGFLKLVDKDLRRYPANGPNRASGVMWGDCEEFETIIIGGTIGNETKTL